MYTFDDVSRRRIRCEKLDANRDLEMGISDVEGKVKAGLLSGVLDPGAFAEGSDRKGRVTDLDH